ncbi:hypothetical protein PhCBS80983_g01181 [Powellomyces hirtus]|uniref:F-box domain-containing protein n=1 Tax=Powellomyces hirtus TaxID=109895 RepID=A0A507EBX2_9FUNG|nr:hypothetical protein PhCBS80983_g01181 [Powellomyces hirtus]
MPTQQQPQSASTVPPATPSTTPHSASAENDRDIALIIRRFPTFPASKRHDLLLALLHQCDPTDMSFLGRVYPLLHRDFLRLLPAPISRAILLLCPPRDLCTVAQVSRSWISRVQDHELWNTLYTQIGLQALVGKCYNVTEGMHSNAHRLSAFERWVRGELHWRTFRAHGSGIVTLGVGTDGMVVTAGVDKTVRVHDARTGKCVRVFSGCEFTCAHGMGKILATGSADGHLRLYSLTSGHLLRELPGHTASITLVRIEPGTIVTGSADQTLKIWVLDAEGGAVLSRTLAGHEAAIKCLDFAKGILVSGDIAGVLRVWHIASGNCLGTLTVSPHSSPTPTFNAFRKHPTLNTRPSPSTAYSSQPPLSFTPPTRHDPVSSIKFTGPSLLFTTLSGRLYLYDVTPLPGSESGLVSYEAVREWAGREGLLVIKQVLSWVDPTTSNTNINNNSGRNEASGGGELPRPKHHPSVWALCSQLDEWRIIAGGSDGSCVVWNHFTGKRVYTLRGATIDKGVRDGGARRLPQSPGDDQDGEAGGAAEGGEEGGSEMNMKAITGVAFDSQRIYAACMNGYIRVWECIDGRTRRRKTDGGGTNDMA